MSGAAESLGLLRTLYAGTPGTWVVTDPASAEMTKYASNAFLATKISFTNEIAKLCGVAAADIDDVVSGMGLDPRIGQDFLRPGLGFGDSCLPKDLSALTHWAGTLGQSVPLLHAVVTTNNLQPLYVLHMLRHEFGDQLSDITVAVLGLRYEPWSDDMRAAPSLRLVPELASLGLSVRVWEPMLQEADVRRHFPGIAVRLANSLAEAVTDAHAALILTEWPEVANADWADLGVRMATPRVVVDGKNCLPPADLAELPLRYHGIGRGPAQPVWPSQMGASISGEDQNEVTPAA